MIAFGWTLLRYWFCCSAAILVCTVAPAWGQVMQTGGVIPQRLSMWSTNNVVMDAGGVGRLPQGLQPFELGIVAPPNLTGNPFPSTAAGAGPNGENACIYDSPLGQAGHYLCFSPNLGSNIASIDFGSVGGGAVGSLQFIVNGTKIPFPGAGGGTVNGPNSSIVTDLACWNNTLGTLLSDCGPSIPGLPSVANNTALIGATRALYPGIILRATYGNGNGAPPQVFTSQAGTCAANSMVSDGGSCQNASDGNSFVAAVPTPADPRQWGVDFSGLTDTTTTFQAVVAWQNAHNGAAITFPQQGGTVQQSAIFSYTTSYATILCPLGRTSVHAIAQPPGGCWFKEKTGAGLSYMLTVIAPSGSTTNGFLTGINMQGLNFDCNNGDAQGAMHITSIRSSDINAFAQHCSGGEAFTLDVVHATPTTFGDTCDTQWNKFDFVTLNNGFTSHSLGMHAWVNPSISNGGCNVSLNDIRAYIYYGGTGGGTSEGVIDEGNDNNDLRLVLVQVAGGGGNSIDIKPRLDSSNLFPANNERFYHLTTNAAYIIRGQTSFPTCVSGSTCPYGISFTDADSGNGTNVPTVETGVRPYLDYDYVTNTGKGLGPQAWPITAAVTCQGGSPGTVVINGTHWSKKGSMVVVDYDFTLGTISGCTNLYFVTLPLVSGVGTYVGYGAASDVTAGSSVAVGPIDGSHSGIDLRFTTNPVSSDRIVGGASYNATGP